MQQMYRVAMSEYSYNNLICVTDHVILTSTWVPILISKYQNILTSTHIYSDNIGSHYVFVIKEWHKSQL